MVPPPAGLVIHKYGTFGPPHVVHAHDRPAAAHVPVRVAPVDGVTVVEVDGPPEGLDWIGLPPYHSRIFHGIFLGLGPVHARMKPCILPVRAICRCAAFQMSSCVCASSLECVYTFTFTHQTALTDQALPNTWNRSQTRNPSSPATRARSRGDHHHGDTHGTD